MFFSILSPTSQADVRERALIAAAKSIEMKTDFSIKAVTADILKSKGWNQAPTGRSLMGRVTQFFRDLDGGFIVMNDKGKPIPIAKEKVAFLEINGMRIKDINIHKLKYYDCILVATNHAKTMIGVMFGDPITTSGGDALGLASHVRLGLTKPTKSEEKITIDGIDRPLYRKTRIVAAKNKLASPFGEMSIRVYQDGRVEEDIPYYEIAKEKGLVSVKGKDVIILVEGYNNITMKKVEFENWIAENPEFLKMVDASMTIEQLEVEEPKQKIALKIGYRK